MIQRRPSRLFPRPHAIGSRSRIRGAASRGDYCVAALLLALLLVQIAARPAAAATWATQEVIANSIANSAQTITPVSAALDASGRPYLAWRSGANTAGDSIRIVRMGPGGWAELTSLPASQIGFGMGAFGGVGALKVDATGTIHLAFQAIAFQDAAAERGVFYGRYTGTVWTVEKIETSSHPLGFRTYRGASLDVDGGGVASIAFAFSDAETRTFVLKFATRAGGGWAVSDLDTVAAPDPQAPGSRDLTFPSLGIDGAGKAHISYMRNVGGTGDDDNLLYITNLGGGWSAPQIVSAGSASNRPGEPNALALDAAGKVHIAFQEGVNNDLLYATNASGSFVTSKVDGDGTTGTASRAGLTLALDINSTGGTLLAYAASAGSFAQSIRAATRAAGGTWVIDTVDATPNSSTIQYGAAISDLGQMTIGYQFTNPSDNSRKAMVAQAAIVVPDTTPPTVDRVTSSAADGAYNAGDTIGIQVDFSEAVTVTGTPQLTLETGAIDRVVDYAGGSGTRTLTFAYSVQAGDTSADLDYKSASALALNGGTIRDGAGNSATLTLAAPGAANSLGASKAIVVDTLAPAAPSVDAPADGSPVGTTTPTIGGTAEPDSTVAIYVDGSSVGTTAADGAGRWSRVVPSALAQGAHTVYTTARDAAGNTSGNSKTNTFTVDTLAPAAPFVAAPTTGAATNDTTPAYSGTAEPGSTVTILVDGAAVGATPAGAGGNWSFAQPIPLAEGTRTVAATAADAAGNTSGISNTNTFVVDTSAPSVQITSPANPRTNAATIPVTVTFGESVSGFDATDIVITNGSIAGVVNGGGASYSFTLAFAGQGAATVDIAANVAADAAGNGNTAASRFGRTYDPVAPSATIASPATDPTNDDPIAVVITFSEGVTGFDASDLAIANGTIVAGSFGGSGTTYTVNLAPAAQGLVTVDIAANVAADAAGNQNTAATQFGRLYDSIAPTVTIDRAAGQADPARGSPVLFTVVFAESVTGFDGSDIALSGTAGATTATVSGSGTTYTVAVSGMAGPGTVVATVPAGAAVDAADNGNAASTSTDNTIAFDNTIPTVAITTTAPEPTNTDPIPLTATFSEDVTGFALGDIAVTNGAAGGFARVSGATYTFTVTPTGQGVVTVSIAAGVAQDAAGNGNIAAPPLDRTYDAVAPTVAITPVAPDPRNGAVASITIVFSEPVAGFDPADLRLARDGGANLLTGAHTLTTADNRTFSLGDLAGLTGTAGTYTLTLAAAGSGIADPAANPLAAGATETWVVDTNLPTVTIEQAAGQSDPAATGPIRFAVTFSKPVTGFDASDVTLTGTAGGTLTATVTGSGTTYEVAVSGMTTGGTVIAAVKTGAAIDGAGNASLPSTSADNVVTFRQQAGVAVSSRGPGSVTPGPGQYPYGPLTLTAAPDPGALFTGWRVDGVVVGWDPTLTLTVSGPRTIEARFAPRPSFSDVAPSGVQWDAITQLAARGIINGYGDGTYGPTDPVQRAQIAALIVRAMGWDGGTPSGPAPFSDLGSVDPELQRAIAILAARGIAKGYEDGTYDPTGEVTHAQAISLITRSMVQAGYWSQVAAAEDDGATYPNIPATSPHRLDILTFVKYAGAIPDRPANRAWQDWEGPSSRGWTAQVLWQALDGYFGINRLP